MRTMSLYADMEEDFRDGAMRLRFMTVFGRG